MNKIEQNKEMIKRFRDAGYNIVIMEKPVKIIVVQPGMANITRVGDAAEGDLLMADMSKPKEFSREDYLLIFYLSQNVISEPKELKTDTVISNVVIYVAKNRNGQCHIFTEIPRLDTDGIWRVDRVGSFTARLPKGACDGLSPENLIKTNLEVAFEDTV